jgi:hypothetical protein
VKAVQGNNISSMKAAPGNAKSVTANLMGDPAPGRREMLQKMGEIKG